MVGDEGGTWAGWPQSPCRVSSAAALRADARVCAAW